MPENSIDPRIVLEARIPTQAAGRRIDQVLAELFPAYSRSRLTGWLKAGDISVDGRVPRPRDPVVGGEAVRVVVLPEPAVHSTAEAIALQILHEDEHVLVIDKPAGLVVHPGIGNPSGTLMNALLHHDPELKRLPRAGIVHRLDKDTTGVLVVARSLPAHAALTAQFAARTVRRLYEAIVSGVIIAGDRIEAALARHPSDHVRRAVREDGKPAITHYRVIERYRAHTRVQCRLETGRTHQIRVHMAHVRHPLVGDPLYGGPLRLPRRAAEPLVAVLRGFRRPALHAREIGFEHPGSQAPVAFRALLPADLLALADALRTDAADNPDG